MRLHSGGVQSESSQVEGTTDPSSFPLLAVLIVVNKVVTQREQEVEMRSYVMGLQCVKGGTGNPAASFPGNLQKLTSLEI